MEPLTLSPPAQIHARRRPAALVFVYAYELMWSLLVAAPFHAWARRVWSAHPDGDAPLFRPGGLDLTSWLLGNEVALGWALRTTLLIFVAGAIIAQLPLGTLLGALATNRNGRSPRTGDALSIGWSALPSIFGVLIFTTILQIFLVGVGTGIAFAVAKAFKNDVTGGKVGIAIGVVAVLLALFVGVLADLWRAAAIRIQNGSNAPTKTRSIVWQALKIALKRQGLGAATLGWSVRALAGVLVVVVGSAASGTALPLFVLFIVHQLAVALRVCLRASWLAQALRIVAQR